MVQRITASSLVLFAVACAENRTVAAVARPAVGLAVQDTVGGWCAEFPADSATIPAEGASATLVFVDDSTRVSARVRVRARRSSDCTTAFPQPRWTSYAAYELELVEKRESLPYLALIVTGDLQLTRVDRSMVRGDIDGDGAADDIRRCAADEGEHFTVWSIPRSGGAPLRRWHEYFDWGAIVDRSCAPGDDGR